MGPLAGRLRGTGGRAHHLGPLASPASEHQLHQLLALRAAAHLSGHVRARGRRGLGEGAGFAGLVGLLLLGGQPLFAGAGPKVKLLVQRGIQKLQVNSALFEKADFEKPALAHVVERARAHAPQLLELGFERVLNQNRSFVLFSCKIATYLVHVVVHFAVAVVDAKIVAVLPELHPVRQHEFAVHLVAGVGFPALDVDAVFYVVLGELVEQLPYGHLQDVAGVVEHHADELKHVFAGEIQVARLFRKPGKIGPYGRCHELLNLDFLQHHAPNLLAHFLGEGQVLPPVALAAAVFRVLDNVPGNAPGVAHAARMGQPLAKVLDAVNGAQQGHKLLPQTVVLGQHIADNVPARHLALVLPAGVEVALLALVLPVESEAVGPLGLLQPDDAYFYVRRPLRVLEAGPQLLDRAARLLNQVQQLLPGAGAGVAQRFRVDQGHDAAQGLHDVVSVQNVQIAAAKGRVHNDARNGHIAAVLQKVLPQHPVVLALQGGLQSRVGFKAVQLFIALVAPVGLLIEHLAHVVENGPAAGARVEYRGEGKLPYFLLFVVAAGAEKRAVPIPHVRAVQRGQHLFNDGIRGRVEIGVVEHGQRE